MIKKALHRILRHRHFWRDASFDELSEVYVAIMFRSLALALIGVFVPVFLIRQGYGFNGVAVFFVFFFLARTVMDIVGGFMTARIGPKHTMLVSYIFQIAAALLFVTLPEQSWPLWIPAILWGSSNSIFYVAFHTDFSKIKHSSHGGKEIGYVNVMERAGGMIGPAFGGIIATIFGGQYIFLVAIALLLIGISPLFRTAEPVKTRQKLRFSDFDVDKIKPDLTSYAFYAVENNLCIALWPAFLTLFVFQENIYATIGSLASIGVIVSMLAAYGVGKMVDKKQGGRLLRFATIANSCVYLIRPFVRGIPAVLGINTVNDALTISYRIPYTKGWYDKADSFPGHRIVYLSVMESFGSFSKFFVWTELYLLTTSFTPFTVIIVGFIVASISSLLINTQQFKALKYNHGR